MNRALVRRLSIPLLLLAATGVTASCAGPSETPDGPNFSKAAAKPISGPSVTNADPAFGREGDVGKQVTVTGSGFVAGANASWERDGVADPKIQVLSTQYVSSTQLVATINIAPDAAIDIYDVSVTNPDRKKGIGYALFQVTQAIAVTGTSVLWGANSNGELVGVLLGNGNSANTGYLYNAGTASLTPIYTNGAVWAIDEAGSTITGNTNGGTVLPIPVWSLVGGAWAFGSLPVGPTSTRGGARSITSDPGTGAAIFIAGMETVACKPNCDGTRPVIWRMGLTGWERVPLPTLGIGQIYVEAVSQGGVAVGASGGHAVVWTPDGSGGYTVAALPGAATVAHGITAAGDLIVGGYNSTNGAAYWTRLAGGAWGAVQSLPIACGDAVDVDDDGRIVANRCPKSSRVSLPAVFTPPYSASTAIWLGGLDPHAGTLVEAISRKNGWIVGQASVGVYWKIP